MGKLPVVGGQLPEWRVGLGIGNSYGGASESRFVASLRMTPLRSVGGGAKELQVPRLAPLRSE